MNINTVLGMIFITMGIIVVIERIFEPRIQKTRSKDVYLFYNSYIGDNQIVRERILLFSL